MHPIVVTVMQRLGLGLMTLGFVSIIIFSSIEMLPGDFGEAVLGQAATEETVAAFRRELGLDKPAYLRYYDWITSAMTGDLGTSFSGRDASGVDRSRPVIDLIAPRLWNTLFLAGMTALVAVPLSLLLGVTAALYRNSLYDRTINATTLTTISFPEFFVSYLLILALASLTQVFPSLANVSDDMDLGERIYKIALPALTLSLFQVTMILRLVRAEMLEVMLTDYIKFSRARGLSERVINFSHALRNTLVPVITIVGILPLVSFKVRNRSSPEPSGSCTSNIATSGRSVLAALMPSAAEDALTTSIPCFSNTL